MIRPARAGLALPLLMTLAGPALAQSSNTGGGVGPGAIRQPNPPQITVPGGPQDTFVVPDQGANSGPGSIETEIRGGTPNARRSNNSGAAGNAERQTAPVGNTGGGGGSGGSNN